MRWLWQPKWIEIAGKRFRWSRRGISSVLSNEAGEVVGEAIGGSAWIERPFKRVGMYIDNKHAKRAIEAALCAEMGG